MFILMKSIKTFEKICWRDMYTINISDHYKYIDICKYFPANLYILENNSAQHDFEKKNIID